jgi:hypothetical protein
MLHYDLMWHMPFDNAVQFNLGVDAGMHGVYRLQASAYFSK